MGGGVAGGPLVVVVVLMRWDGLAESMVSLAPGGEDELRFVATVGRWGCFTSNR